MRLTYILAIGYSECIRVEDFGASIAFPVWEVLARGRGEVPIRPDSPLVVEVQLSASSGAVICRQQFWVVFDLVNGLSNGQILLFRPIPLPGIWHLPWKQLEKSVEDEMGSSATVLSQVNDQLGLFFANGSFQKGFEGFLEAGASAVAFGGEGRNAENSDVFISLALEEIAANIAF